MLMRYLSVLDKYLGFSGILSIFGIISFFGARAESCV